MRFKEFYLIEKKINKGTAFEGAFTNAWNAIKIQKNSSKLIRKIDLACINIINSISTKCSVESDSVCIKEDVKAEHIGDIKDFALNELWRFYIHPTAAKGDLENEFKKIAKVYATSEWPTGTLNPDSTPKTDVKIGDFHISMKLLEDGKFRLASSKIKEGEGQAIIFYALDEVDKHSEQKISKILINNIFSLITSEKDLIGNKIPKETRDDDTDENKETIIINKQGETETVPKFKLNQHRLANYLRIAIRNTVFRETFLGELITGNLKFAKDEPDPKATHILEFDSHGENVLFKKIDRALITFLTQFLDLNISWTGSGKTSDAGFSVHIDTSKEKFFDPNFKSLKKDITDYEVNKTLNPEVSESLIFDSEKLFTYAESLGINTQLINEGFFDPLTNSFKQFGKKAVEFLKRVFSTLIEILKKGVIYFLTFFGIYPTIQETNLDRPAFSLKGL